MDGEEGGVADGVAEAQELERRFALPLAAALRTDVAIMPADTTLSEVFSHHLLGNREKAVAVADGARYLGIMRIEELQAIPEGEWATEEVGHHMRTDFPVVAPGESVRAALTIVEDADIDLLPVIDDKILVGVVTTTEILKLDEIVGRTGDEI